MTMYRQHSPRKAESPERLIIKRSGRPRLSLTGSGGPDSYRICAPLANRQFGASRLTGVGGAHLWPHADDAINLFALAMHTGMTAGAVRNVLDAYPSVSGDIIFMVSAKSPRVSSTCPC